MLDAPCFVRIEYWNSSTLEWYAGHAGINLMDPAKYVKKHSLTRGLARAIDLDTGEIVYGKGDDIL